MKRLGFAQSFYSPNSGVHLGGNSRFPTKRCLPRFDRAQPARQVKAREKTLIGRRDFRRLMRKEFEIWMCAENQARLEACEIYGFGPAWERNTPRQRATTAPVSLEKCAHRRRSG